MAQSSSETGTGSAKRPKVEWTLWALLGVLGIGVVIAVKVHLARAYELSPEGQLHGDMDEATGALEMVLKKTPADQRLALLLKSAQDPNPGLRYAAIDALGSSGTPGTADVLEHAFEDSSSVVRQ